ncbi:MAG: isoamylase early set domain-containing protein [Nitrospiraceae bacterium]|nr:MAG: isoamylase early set domain-containing protein [Nitrospiraceae bacterium]
MKKNFIKKVAKKLNVSEKISSNRRNGRIKKEYLKSRPGCKVTFRLPKDAAPQAQIVNIAGDFNNWDKDHTKMKQLKNGDFTITLELEKGREYRFRYLIDNRRWENDWFADKYVPNLYGGDDSVVVV